MSLFKFLRRAQAIATATKVIDDSWLLLVGDELLGELKFVSYEFPWTNCEFEQFERFNYYEKYFEFLDRPDNDEETDDDIDPEMLSLWDEVRSKGGYRLVAKPSGEVTLGPTLHVGEGYATFR